MRKPNKKVIIFSLLLLIVFTLAGYMAGRENPQGSFVFIENLFPVSNLQNSSVFMQFAFIFINNFVKSFFVISLGIFFGLFPIYFLGINGFLIGLVAAAISSLRGWNFFFAGIMPHGIFEITALVLASAYGIGLGLAFFRFTIFGEKLDFKKELNNAWGYFFKIVAPLILIAAIIEVTLTPFLVRSILK